ncbi:hypothetical protein CC86DRAFT_409824 [Ophiobolus disseminans]|uniref:Uncharacterized protein n=1 Tax=Ophiobolus disseminans TaxID=1469910 RepID=A0A6A6ZQK0_9PLEO|nr:hypothetical protein CC86DRAFT_409824 [Ophiobolus disseminans]
MVLELNELTAAPGRNGRPSETFELFLQTCSRRYQRKLRKVTLWENILPMKTSVFDFHARFSRFPLLTFCIQNPQCEVIVRVGLLKPHTAVCEWIQTGSMLQFMLHGTKTTAWARRYLPDVAVGDLYLDSPPIPSNLKFFPDAQPKDMVNLLFPAYMEYMDDPKGEQKAQMLKWCEDGF